MVKILVLFLIYFMKSNQNHLQILNSYAIKINRENVRIKVF